MGWGVGRGWEGSEGLSKARRTKFYYCIGYKSKQSGRFPNGYMRLTQRSTLMRRCLNAMYLVDYVGGECREVIHPYTGDLLV